MRKLGKGLGRLILIILCVAALIWVAPREGIVRTPIEADLSDPAGYLAAREEGHDDIIPGTAARIIWAGEEGVSTEWSVVYLHGFSATSEEIRPVPDRLAEALGANLVYARLRGHGRSGEALASVRAGDWVDDTALFLDIARAVGERVLILSTSTGGTLAAYAATEPGMAADVAGIAFLSPNFRLANPAGALLELPYARVWGPWIAGAERQFEPINDAHDTYWTTTYPMEATVSLGTLLRETRARDYSALSLPAIFLFSDQDQVVSAAAAREFAAGWGGPVTLQPLALPQDGSDPYAHVIAGDILSPAMTEPVTQTLIEWARALR